MIEYLTHIIRLLRGERVSLTKRHPGMNKILVGLGWDVNKGDSADFDLDVSVFLLTSDDKVTSDGDFVFYNHLKHASGSVEHMGDNRTGQGEGDDEQIFVDLSKIPSSVDKVNFAVTIYKAGERQQNFGQVSNAYIRVMHEGSHTELVRYDLGTVFSDETALLVGGLYRNRDEYKSALQRSSSVIGARGISRNEREWKFDAIGKGFQGGLRELCLRYGVSEQVSLEKPLHGQGDSRIGC